MKSLYFLLLLAMAGMAHAGSKITLRDGWEICQSSPGEHPQYLYISIPMDKDGYIAVPQFQAQLDALTKRVRTLENTIWISTTNSMMKENFEYLDYYRVDQEKRIEALESFMNDAKSRESRSNPYAPRILGEFKDAGHGPEPEHYDQAVTTENRFH